MLSLRGFYLPGIVGARQAHGLAFLEACSGDIHSKEPVRVWVSNLVLGTQVQLAQHELESQNLSSLSFPSYRVLRYLQSYCLMYRHFDFGRQALSAKISPSELVAGLATGVTVRPTGRN
jgi:hypothetical protein